MRRIPSTLIGTLLVLGGVLTLAPAPAGAAGHAARSLHAHAAPTGSGAGGRITSPVPPLTTGYVEYTDQSGQFQNVSGAVQIPTDPSGNGSTLDIRMTADIPGTGPTNIPVTVSSGNPGVPLAVGHQYGTGLTGAATLLDCNSATSGQSVGVQIDQLTEVAGVITSAAVQVVCTVGGPAPQSVYTAMAYNAVPTTPHQGYYTYESDGLLTPFGNDNYLVYLGDLSAHPINQPVVGMAQTADGGGYWMVAADGGIFAYGDAGFYGSAGNLRLNKPIVGMAATKDGKGYWLVASDGGIFAYGDAGFYGSMGGSPLNKPVVGMSTSSDGKGYRLVASDGGIFAFGDAAFYGSMGGTPLNKPVVGMTATLDGKGYWFVASDGGIFSFGDASFFGSAGALTLQRPIVGMASTADNHGYWLVASDGGIFAYGDAPFYGSIPAYGGQVTDVVGLSTLPGVPV
jgi:hypothetical protein